MYEVIRRPDGTSYSVFTDLSDTQVFLRATFEKPLPDKEIEALGRRLLHTLVSMTDQVREP